MNTNFKQKKFLKDFVDEETGLSLKIIYDLVKNEYKDIMEQIKYNNKYINKKYDLIILNLNDNNINFKIGKRNFQTLYPPLKIKFIINGKSYEFPLISDIQFYSLVEELKIQNPEIVYYQDNKKYTENYDYLKYINLYNNNIIINNF